MSQTPSISVVIPTFNRSKTLIRALRSVEKQTRSADEIIVVDNDSSDDTQVMLRQQFPDVISLVQSRRGVSAARNMGIREAKGDWLAFLDSDDEWLPEKLEKQLAWIASSGPYWICHTNEIWVRHGVRVNQMQKHKKYGGWIFDRCLPLCVISPSSVLIHRQLLTSVGLFDETLPACEDYDLWLRICSRYPVLYINEPLLIKYGGHSDQLSRTIWGLDRYRIQALEKIIQSKDFPADYHAETIKTLIKKIDIFLLGAEKRGRLKEAETYKAKRLKYTELQNR